MENKIISVLVFLFLGLCEVQSQTTPCAINETNSCGNESFYIRHVKLESIDNSSSCAAYTDFTAISTNIRKEETYTLEIEPSAVGLESNPNLGNWLVENSVAAWIDFNDDGDLTGTGEKLGEVGIAEDLAGGDRINITFSVPSGAVTGPVIMRIHFAYWAGLSPCGSVSPSFTNEVEDYVVDILPPDPRPNPDFSADKTSEVAPEIVTFTDLSTNSPTNWIWNITPASGWSFETGFSANSQNPQINFTSPGFYSVELTAINGDGARTATKTDYIEIISPLPVADFSADDEIVPSGTDVVFTDASTNSPTTWSWSVTPSTGWSYVNGTDENSQNPAINFVDEGFYTVELTATNAFGSDTETKTDYIEVQEPLPVVTFEADTTCIVLNDIVRFSSQIQNNYTDVLVSITSGFGSVEFTEGTNSSSENPVVKFTSLGTYSVQYTVWNSAGQVREKKNAYINVTKGKPKANFKIGFGSDVIDPGEERYLSVDGLFSGYSPTLSRTWEVIPATGWDYIMGTNANSTSPNYRFNEPGKYSFKLTLTNCFGSHDTTIFDFITVNANGAPVADFEADQTTVGRGSIINFTDLSTQLPTAWEWTVTPATGWEFVDGTDSGSENPKIRFNTVGNYSISLKSTNSLGENTASKTDYIEVFELAPKADFEADLTKIFLNDMVTFTDISTNSPDSWLWEITPTNGWSFVGGTTNASQNPKIEFVEAGLYTIKLTATNSTGSDDTIKIDFIDVVSDVGIMESNLAFTLFPNPAKEELFLKFTDVNNIISFVITDVNGSVIRVNEAPEFENKIDLSSLQKGIYFVQVFGEGFHTSKRFLKN